LLYPTRYAVIAFVIAFCAALITAFSMMLFPFQ
jgi:hypothetical protein